MKKVGRKQIELIKTKQKKVNKQQLQGFSTKLLGCSYQWGFQQQVLMLEHFFSFFANKSKKLGRTRILFPYPEELIVFLSTCSPCSDQIQMHESSGKDFHNLFMQPH